MDDWEISADTAERIYDKRKNLDRLDDALVRLDTQRSFAADGSDELDELDAKIDDLSRRRDELAAEIEAMESDYQAWLAERG